MIWSLPAGKLQTQLLWVVYNTQCQTLPGLAGPSCTRFLCKTLRLLRSLLQMSRGGSLSKRSGR